MLGFVIGASCSKRAQGQRAAQAGDSASQLNKEFNSFSNKGLKGASPVR